MKRVPRRLRGTERGIKQMRRRWSHRGNGGWVSKMEWSTEPNAVGIRDHHPDLVIRRPLLTLVRMAKVGALSRARGG